MTRGTLYGLTASQRRLLAQVRSEADDILGQLRALAQHAHHGADLDDVEAVRGALSSASNKRRNGRSNTYLPVACRLSGTTVIRDRFSGLDTVTVGGNAGRTFARGR